MPFMIFQKKKTKEKRKISLRKQPTLHEIATWVPCKTTSEERAQKFHTDDVHYPDLGSACDWLKENSLPAQPIRSTTKIWAVYVISMEFLRSLLRRRFARAQVATSWNVGCFQAKKKSVL